MKLETKLNQWIITNSTYDLQFNKLKYELSFDMRMTNNLQKLNKNNIISY